MAAYNDYKTTQTLGFDSIPYDWDIKKVKYLFSIGRGRVIAQEELMVDGLYPVYSSQTQNNGCLGYINSFDFDCDQLTWTTDGANAGTIFIRSGKHNCTNVCGTLQLKSSLTSLNFIYYALQYAAQFYKRPDTNGAKIMNNEMAEIGLATPSILEQQKIIEFLDHETAQIDTLIDKQQTLIQLLKEKREAVISHAVTKGLNPDAPMKDSGVEWLGEVPEHWEVTKLGFHTSKIGSGKTPRGGAEVYQEEGVLFLRSQNVYNDSLRIDKSESVFISEVIHEEMSNTKVQGGDILLNVTGGSIGRTCIVPDNFIEANVNQHVCIVRLPTSMRYFVAFLLKSSLIKEQIDSIQTGGNREGLNFEQISKFIICLPPEKERKDIVDYIESETNKIDNLLEQANTAIQLMQERRTALISAAVTGKIDVRGWVKPNFY